MLARALIVAAVTWPLVAGAAHWQRASHETGGEPMWATIVYLAGSQICHQRPERSFHTHATAWPVCARCSGLYLAAPLWGLVAVARTKRRARASACATRPGLKPGTSAPTRYVRILVLAAIPTVLTLAWEWGGMGTPSNLVRFSSALPLGAAIMHVLVQVSSPVPGPMRVDRIN